jgi:hypothetical protein
MQGEVLGKLPGGLRGEVDLLVDVFSGARTSPATSLSSSTARPLRAEACGVIVANIAGRPRLAFARGQAATILG